MVEFSEDLSKRYTDQQALYHRVQTRLQFEKHIVPYTQYGVDYGLFQYDQGQLLASLKTMFADMNTSIQIDGGRVTVAGISVDMEIPGVVR